MEYFELWDGGPVMEGSRDAEPVTTDSVLLANFPSLSGVRRAADFGCGSGVLGLILAARSKTVKIDLVEIAPAAADAAARNVELNGLGDRLRVLRRDLRTLREAEVGKYQLIISNPPYFPVGSGTAPAAGRQVAREERECTLSELARTASRLLGDGGRLAVAYPSERLAEAVCALSGAGLEPKRLRLVQTRLQSAPFLALLECRRGGKPGLSVEPVLILKNPDGTDTGEVRKIYRLPSPTTGEGGNK